MYAPLGGRLLALKIVFGFMVAISLAAVVSGVFELRLLDDMIAGGNVSDSEIDNNDIRQALVGFAQFVTWIGCVVVFMMWLWRAYGNVDAVAPGVRRYDRGWAIDVIWHPEFAREDYVRVDLLVRPGGWCR